MSTSFYRKMKAKISELRSRVTARVDMSKYANDPVEYARRVLEVNLTPRQEEILQAVLEPPYRVLVPSGHDVGKSFCGGVICSWWFDTRDPSICLTTAPKLEQVKDILWKEIRSLRTRRGLGGFTGPKSLRLETSPRHYAKGMTANVQGGFQGAHEKNVLLLVDEAEDCERWVFEAGKTMATGEGHAIVCFYNPYTSTSHVAQEEQAVDALGNPSWRMLPMSSLDHPNIEAELRGEPPPFPQAVRLQKVEQWIQDWCQPIDEIDAKATDILWPPIPFKRVQRWYRPGPRFEAGALGRRPTQAVDSVWSAALVDKCIKNQLPMVGPIQLGIDVARFGDDFTCFHIRIGGCSLHHEAVNGWSTVEIARRAQYLTQQWGAKFGVEGRRVLIAVDDCGVGGGVTDWLASVGWSVCGVNVANTAPDEEKFDNLRSSLWCELADEAGRGNLDFSRLSREVQQTLRREFPSQQYKQDTRGRRCCLPKSTVKQMLGRSPDNSDAVILAYANVSAIGDRVGGQVHIPGGI